MSAYRILKHIEQEAGGRSSSAQCPAPFELVVTTVSGRSVVGALKHSNEYFLEIETNDAMQFICESGAKFLISEEIKRVLVPMDKIEGMAVKWL